MKILVVSHMYPSIPNPTYGVFIHKQVKALQKLGCEVRVISPVPYAPWPLRVWKEKWRAYASVPVHDFYDGVEVYYPRYLEFPRSFLLEHAGFFMFLGMRKLVERLARDFPFDLLHAHVALPDGHCASLLRKGYQVPFLVSIHGQDFQSTINRGPRARKKLRQVLQRAGRVITVSTKLKNLVKEEPYYGQISVIANGIDPEDCKTREPRAWTSRIISIANLKKTKGIDLNIRAIALLTGKYPNLKYTVVGDGEERPNLEKLAAELNLGPNVEFLGKLRHSEAMDRLAAADIFCLPSWQEGFGVVYIEAMAQGIPVIGVRGEGIEDVIDPGKNGILVRPKVVGDIAEALDALLQDPALARRLGEAGRETVLTGYTWEHNGIKTVEIYQQLLSPVHTG
jgi:teichuronic acid biosynthesis glycosyltransferase TuaC